MTCTKFSFNYSRVSPEQGNQIEELFTEFDEIFKDNQPIQQLFTKVDNNFNNNKISPAKLVIIFYNSENAGCIETLNWLKFVHYKRSDCNLDDEQIQIKLSNQSVGIVFGFLSSLCDFNNDIVNIKFENYKNDKDGTSFALAKEEIYYQKNLYFISESLNIFQQHSQLITSKYDLWQPPYYYNNFSNIYRII